MLISGFHVFPLVGHSHEQRTLFRILVRFWWPMFDKEVDQFIRACSHFQLVNSFSHKAQQLLQTIELDTQFDVVFIGFWEPGDIPDQDGYCKILTCLYCMTGFGLAAATGMKKIESHQAARWAFVKFFATFGLPKIIVVDADGLFF